MRKLYRILQAAYVNIILFSKGGCIMVLSLNEGTGEALRREMAAGGRNAVRLDILGFG
jgi:hypothetical protein